MEQKAIEKKSILTDFSNILYDQTQIYQNQQYDNIEATIKKQIKKKLILKKSKVLIESLNITNNYQEIMNRRSFLQTQLPENTISCLKKVKECQDSIFKLNANFMLAVEDEEIYRNLRAKHSDLYVYLLTDRNGLEEIKLSDQCRFIVTSDSKFRFQLENFENVIICEDRLESYYPEKIICDIMKNSNKISAMIEAVCLISDSACYEKYANLFEQNLYDDFSINSFKNDFMIKLKNANIELKDQISKMNLTGDVLIKMQQGFALHEIDEFSTLIESKIQSLIGELNGTNLDRIFQVDNFEIQLEENAFDLYTKETMFRALEQSYSKYSSLATQFLEYRKELNELNQLVMIVDTIQAVQSFENSYEGIYSLIQNENHFAFESAVNLEVKNADPVSYHTDGVSSILLTGANSGGKTSLLNTISQQFILTMLGLKVPAKSSTLYLPDQMFYFVKENGQLNSGAFEQLLNKFAGINQATKKLILADEVESVTQPSAACKIINGLTKWFDNSLSIFVTHLGDELSKVNTDSRIDGIVATGVENNQIIVDRNPRINHLATSTPKLIIEKLNGSNENAFFKHLLAEFD